MDEPAEVVRAFIADHFRWNASALKRSSAAGRSESRERAADEKIEKEWAALLSKYCKPGFVGESIAYGIPPLHDPKGEIVVSSTARRNRCLVKSLLTQDVGGVKMIQEFEYRLSQVGDRWYLESVKCLVDGRRYESL